MYRPTYELFLISIFITMLSVIKERAKKSVYQIHMICNGLFSLSIVSQRDGGDGYCSYRLSTHLFMVSFFFQRHCKLYLIKIQLILNLF